MIATRWLSQIKIPALITINLFCATFSQAQDFSVLHEFDRENPPGNIAVSKNNRIFMSNHFFYGAQHKIVEILKDGTASPYPNKLFSQSLNPVLGVVVDNKNILWMLETASGKDRAGRLIGWDIKKDKLYKTIYLALPVIPEDSFLNDLAVDRKNEAIYITDTASAKTTALIVVNLKTGKARRVLEGSPFTQPEDIAMIIDKKVVMLGGGHAKVGVNPITIDNKSEWVYFGPMTGKKLFRVKTQDLLDTTLTEATLQSRVELYAYKPISDGITIDAENNIYITDISSNSIGYIDKNKKYHKLFSDEKRLSWPDGFAVAPNNKIYATVNQLHKSPVLNSGDDDSDGKYYIIQFDALSKTRIGR